jgi:signal transduction histidine kinase/CheY-like chemotaxis protein
MLSGAVDGDPPEMSPDVLIEPIAFAGRMQGTIRVSLPRGRVPSLGDREVLKLLALQCSVAMVNAEYTEQLMRLKEASEESVKAKTGFLANLSHEIRGPLGIMLNAVELVLDGLCGQITEDQLETLSMVRSNGAHLLELINDVLDYAKVESGKMTVSKVDVPVHDLLQDIVKIARGQAEAKRHRLEYTPPEGPLTISIDRRHARQIMINLVTNAIKYTPAGGCITIWADRVTVGKVRINVQDTGVGIDRGDRAKVFSAFERVDDSYSRNQAGTGLGMPLTKRLVEANGGTIEFESVPKQGSHFWILFDAVDSPQAGVAVPTEAPVVVEGKGRSVLIVGEDDRERQMTARYFTHVGFKVVLAATRDACVALLAASDVELVLLDYNSLDVPVELIVREIRGQGERRPVPIVLMSSHAFVFDIERYLKAGIDRCLVKPVPFADLGKTCDDLLHAYGSSVAGASRVAGEGQRGRESLLEPKNMYH